MHGISKTWIWALAVCLLTVGTLAADEPAGKVEPALKFNLKIGDKTIQVSEDQPVDLPGTFTDPKVTLSVEPFREFPYGGVKFKYPRHFTFEADLEDANVHIWTMSGNDFKIMLFVMDEDLPVDTYINQLAQQFGDDNCQKSKSPDRKFNKADPAGSGMTVKIGEAPIRMDAYPLSKLGKQFRMLVLQDNADANSNSSTEGKAALKMLEDSFESP